MSSKPIYSKYLYIKQHSVTGLLYFGQTTQFPLNYLGSGKYWKHHIKKHGKEHVVTLWFEKFDNESNLIQFAQEFSKSMRIVESNQWANLVEETGVGGFNGHHTEEAKQKLRIAKGGENHHFFGKQLSIEHRKKISDSNVGTRLGVPKSEIHKKKIGDTLRGIPKPKVVCPHCGKIGGVAIMHRYHFHRCKLNNT